MDTVAPTPCSDLAHALSHPRRAHGRPCRTAPPPCLLLHAQLTHSPSLPWPLPCSAARKHQPCSTRACRSRVVGSHRGSYSGHRRAARTQPGRYTLPWHEWDLAAGAPCLPDAEEPALASHRASQRCWPPSFAAGLHRAASSEAADSPRSPRGPRTSPPGPSPPPSPPWPEIDPAAASSAR
jgi:hypothetical protein